MPMLTNGGGLIFLIVAGFIAWYVRDSWRRSQPARTEHDPAPTCVILCADEGHDAIVGQHLAHAAHCCDCDDLDRELAELMRRGGA